MNRKARLSGAVTVGVVVLMSVTVGPAEAGWKKGGGPTTTSTTVAGSARTVPTSIASDCSKPVDVALNSFLAGVPNGATVQFKIDGCYGIDRSLLLDDRSNLVLDGRGSTFKALTQREDDPCRANWRIQGGSNITLKNMTVRGANNTGFDGPRPDFRGQCQHGYSFDSTQGATLLNSKAYDTWGDPISVGPDRRQAGNYCVVPPSRNILVDNFYGMNSGRTVGISHADGVTIQNSYFGDLYDSAIDLETDVACEWSRNVKILNNRFGRFRYAVLAYTGGEPPERSGNFEFSGNVTEAEPVSCYPALYIQPLGSYSDPESYVGIRQNFIIRNNTLKTLGDGIRIHKAGGVRIENNTFTKNYGFGCANAAFPWYPGALGATLLDVHTANVYGNTLVGGLLGGFQGEWYADPTSTGITSTLPA